VFTEKKTDRYTAVVSVAVKAIAVARGYVSNEGTGAELGFQPYLRGESPRSYGQGGASFFAIPNPAWKAGSILSA